MKKTSKKTTKKSVLDTILTSDAKEVAPITLESSVIIEKIADAKEGKEVAPVKAVSGYKSKVSDYVSPYILFAPHTPVMPVSYPAIEKGTYVSPYDSIDLTIPVKADNPVTTLEELKSKVLASLNSPDFELPFFSEVIYNLLLEEGKIVNKPEANRTSKYHSLPFSMPYNEEFMQRGFSGTRGRCFFSLCLNKSAEEFITFESNSRRKEEGARIEPFLYYRTLQAMCKAYFPLQQKTFKSTYPVKVFKGE